MRALKWMVIAAIVHCATAGNASAGANTQLGIVVPLDGSPLKANVLLFFRPDQRNMQDTLRALAACQKELAGKPVRWVGVVPSRFSADDAKAYASEVGLSLQIVVDQDQALHALVGIAMHPSVAILDGQRKLAQFQPYMKLNFCESVMARIRFVLGELDEAGLARALDPSSAPAPSVTASAAKRDVKLAEMLLAGGNVEKALEMAKKGVNNDPQSAAAHTVLGRALAAGGDCAAAKAAFEAALKLDPSAAQARAGRDSCGKK